MLLVNNLTGFGAFTAEQGVGNNWSVDFNGSSQYATVTTSSIAAPFAILAWLKFDTLGVQDPIINFGLHTDSSNTRLELDSSDTNDLTFHDPGLVQNRTSSNIISTGSWISVALSWDGNALGTTAPPPDYWVDSTHYNPASLSGSGTPSAISATAISLFKHSSSYFDGHCASFALWLGELTSAEITELHNAGPGAALTADFGDYTSSADLKHHWAFENGSGSTVTDEAGNADLTLVGSPTWSSDVPS